MKRRHFIESIGLVPLTALAQSESKVVDLKSIGAGSFEFPLEGKYEVERKGAATVFNLNGGRRIVTVGLLRRPSSGAAAKGEQLNQAEGMLKRSWTKFAESQGGVVTSPFLRSDPRDGLALMSMATEFRPSGGQQFYLNFAVTDGQELVNLTIEGQGNAADAERELGPVMRAFVYAPRSN